MIINKDALIIGGAVVIGLFILGQFKGATKAVASGVAKGAVSVAEGAVSGAVIGVADVFGIPETKLTDCEKAQQEGRQWDASFLCPAGKFIKGLF